MKKTFPKSEEELADRFDAGEDLESLGFDVKEAVVERPRLKRVNVDFPEHMLAMLDRGGTAGHQPPSANQNMAVRKTARSREISSPLVAQCPI
jgi:hypothetical protein